MWPGIRCGCVATRRNAVHSGQHNWVRCERVAACDGGYGFTDSKVWLKSERALGGEYEREGAERESELHPDRGDNVYIPSIIGSGAEVALWDALDPYTTFDPQDKGKPRRRVSPMRIHRKPLFYAPLMGGLQDVVGGDADGV